MNRQFALFMAAVAALLSLAACAGSGTPEDSATSETLSTGVTGTTTATVSSASELLTPADVEQVSGLLGLDVVPYDPSVGDESFIGPDPEALPATYVFRFQKGDVAIVIDAFIVPGKGGDGTLRRGSAGAGGDRCGAAVSAIAAGRLRA